MDAPQRVIDFGRGTVIHGGHRWSTVVTVRSNAVCDAVTEASIRRNHQILPSLDVARRDALAHTAHTKEEWSNDISSPLEPS